MIACGQCGRAMPSLHRDGLYHEGEPLRCRCGAVHEITVDDSRDPPVAYVREWRCKHGIDGDVTCEECAAEETLP